MRSSKLVLFNFFFVFFYLISIEFQVGGAFVGTYGINYGRLADNILSPDKVVLLLKQAKIRNVRIYDADHTVLEAFSGTGLDLVVGLPNGFLLEMSSNSDHAFTWVKDNVQSFLPKTRIRGISVGNEVLGGSDSELSGALLGAAKNVYNALKKLNLEKTVQITTPHSQDVLADSYLPSSCVFKEDLVQVMKPLLEFFNQIGSPFCLDAYPFQAYTYNPKEIDINYALFKPTEGIYDPKTNLHYDNMLDALIDAAYMALQNVGFKKMEVMITETGWPSKGDSDEPAATPENARTYNYNLRKRLAKNQGTPLRPKTVLKAYIFALFNENAKRGKSSETHFGLFKPDGTISYDIGFKSLKSDATKSLISSSKAARYYAALIISVSIFLLMI